MKPVKIVLALACSLGLVGSVQGAPQHSHQNHATQAAEAKAALPVQRWAPDASLREGIRRAYTAVDQLHHHEMGHLSAPMAVARAAEVEAAVAYMFANCKLAAEPDAALHGILVPLLGAAQALKSDPQDLKAVADMRTALAHYPQSFDDPGWDQPALSGHVMHDEP